MMMKKTLVLTTVLVAGMAMAAPDPFDVKVANIGLLQLKEVQKELKVNESQRKQLNKHADWFNSENQKLGQQAQKYIKDRKPVPKSIEAKGEKIAKDFQKKVVSVMSIWQMKRLREITLQDVGFLALLNDDIAKKLSLSATQKKNLKTKFEATTKSAAKIEADTAKPIIDKYKDKKPKNEAEAKSLTASFNKEMEAAMKKATPKINKLQTDWLAYVKKTLSKAQQNKFKALQGPPFKAKKS